MVVMLIGRPLTARNTTSIKHEYQAEAKQEEIEYEVVPGS